MLLLLGYFSFGTVLFAFLVPVLILAVPAIKAALFNTNNSYVQFFAYYITFLLAYVMSGPTFIFVPMCSARCCKAKPDLDRGPSEQSPLVSKNN